MSPRQELTTYRLTDAEFRELGAGYGDESTLATLRSAQASKRLLLLRAVHDRAAGTEEWKASNLDESWNALRDITANRSDVGRQVLSHPFVDSWAMRCLRQLSGGAFRRQANRGLVDDLGYLSCLVAAAAVRAGADLNLVVQPREAQLSLPTVGLAYDLGPGPATVTCSGGELTITGSRRTVRVAEPYTQDAPGWHARRSLTVQSPASQFTVAVEDLDVYRSCFGLPVTPRLAPSELRRLESLLDGAWRLISADHPLHASAMSQCLQSLVPLVTPNEGSISASTQTAFGAVAVSLPADAAGLALLLIHEMQHVKLGAVLDLVDLSDPSNDAVFHAPWRADPRPARALLQGVYAHAGVADFWRVRRHRTSGAPARLADFEFSYWLDQTRRGAHTLASSGALTDYGERFVSHLTETLDSWRSEPLRETLAARTNDLVTAVATRWRLDNYRTEPDVVSRLASAWRTGAPCPRLDPPAVSRTAVGGPAHVDGLAAQLRARLVEAAPLPARPADVACLEGHPHDATAAYRRAIIAAPEGAAAWADFALAISSSGDVDAARALLERPDLVRATFLELTGIGSPPALDDLARWLVTGLC